MKEILKDILYFNVDTCLDLRISPTSWFFNNKDGILVKFNNGIPQSWFYSKGSKIYKRLKRKYFGGKK